MLELAQKRRKERKRKMNKDEEMEVDKPFTSGPQNTREGTSKEKKDDSSPPDDSGPGPSQVDPKWKYRGRPDSSDDEEDATSVKQTAHDESFLSKCKKNLEKVREWWRDVQILPFFRSTAECCREPTTHEYKPFVFDYATSSAPPSPDPSRPPSPQSKGSPIKRSDSESSLDSEFQSARDESSDDEEPMFPDASPNY